MKKNLTIESTCFHTVKKALLIMKLTFVLLLVGILQVSAKVNGQSAVSLKLLRTRVITGSFIIIISKTSVQKLILM